MKLAIDSWGPRQWGVMETFAQLYPLQALEEERAFATDLFASGGIFSALLPCDLCRQHYDQYAAQNPPVVSGREALVRWVNGAHNAVNARYNKRQWTFEEVNESYRGPGWRQSFYAQPRAAHQRPKSVPRRAQACPPAQPCTHASNNLRSKTVIGASIAVTAVAVVAVVVLLTQSTRSRNRYRAP